MTNKVKGYGIYRKDGKGMEFYEYTFTKENAYRILKIYNDSYADGKTFIFPIEIIRGKKFI